MERIFEIIDKQKFRPLPLMTRGNSDKTYTLYDDEKVRKCSREKGHVLTISHGEVVCTECPAQWKDEGF